MSIKKLMQPTKDSYILDRHIFQLQITDMIAARPMEREFKMNWGTTIFLSVIIKFMSD